MITSKTHYFFLMFSISSLSYASENDSPNLVKFLLRTRKMIRLETPQRENPLPNDGYESAGKLAIFEIVRKKQPIQGIIQEESQITEPIYIQRAKL